MIAGFDVSKWQDPGRWDWKQLGELSSKLEETKGRKLIFVARATYGARKLDERFAQYAKLVRENGLLFGAYHFYRQVHTVDEQLRNWDKAMELIGDSRPGELFPVLDMEDNSVNGDGRVRKKLWNKACEEIGQTWVDRYGRCILYYSSYFPDLLDAYRDDPDWMWMRDPQYIHWLADYSAETGNPRTPYTNEWHLHQARPKSVPYYAKGKSPVDCNYAAPDLCVDELTILRSTWPKGDEPVVLKKDDPYGL